ncbi:GcrA family cell cycle regulator [Bradyrhizobium japonicum]|uniref:GcrA family cell cycle regulator n=1 Tax=Bradyrhizobium japonicum TaxID=375 RepID=UPI001BA9A3C9|nr:GcrA family cell cycle regulator [Bradyrhizobium japonicum]MBR0962211.1 GcrA cell cycle regulator [Bradyrhizobium japonicum]
MTVHHPQLAQAQAEAGRGWTATRISVAKALFNSGKSAAQVACLIGGVTRNAVIGKINRDGLKDADRKVSRAAGQARAERRRSRSATAERGPVVSVRKLPPKDAPPPNIIDQQIPVGQRRTLAQLDSACCHWPVGDPQTPEFFFCGAPKTDDAGIPYCPSHLFRSQQRDVRPRKGAGFFANAGPGAAWRAG